MQLNRRILFGGFSRTEKLASGVFNMGMWLILILGVYNRRMSKQNMAEVSLVL